MENIFQVAEKLSKSSSLELLLFEDKLHYGAWYSRRAFQERDR
jgi:hypothetical protein